MVRDTGPATTYMESSAGPMIAATVPRVVEASINLADDQELEKADQNLRFSSAL
jgi:hypothetical protein